MEDNWKMLVQYNVLGGGLTMEVVSKIINVMNAPTNPTITPTITQSCRCRQHWTIHLHDPNTQHALLKGGIRPLVNSHKVALILYYIIGM